MWLVYLLYSFYMKDGFFLNADLRQKWNSFWSLYLYVCINTRHKNTRHKIQSAFWRLKCSADAVMNENTYFWKMKSLIFFSPPHVTCLSSGTWCLSLLETSTLKGIKPERVCLWPSSPTPHNLKNMAIISRFNPIWVLHLTVSINLMAENWALDHGLLILWHAAMLGQTSWVRID